MLLDWIQHFFLTEFFLNTTVNKHFVNRFCVTPYILLFTNKNFYCTFFVTFKQQLPRANI